MVKNGIEMWISPSHGSATVDCPFHNAEHLEGCGYEKGYFLTQADLEAALIAAFQEGDSQYNEISESAARRYIKSLQSIESKE